MLIYSPATSHFPAGDSHAAKRLGMTGRRQTVRRTFFRQLTTICHPEERSDVGISGSAVPVFSAPINIVQPKRYSMLIYSPATSHFPAGDSHAAKRLGMTGEWWASGCAKMERLSQNMAVQINHMGIGCHNQSYFRRPFPALQLFFPFQRCRIHQRHHTRRI